MLMVSLGSSVYCKIAVLLGEAHSGFIKKYQQKLSPDLVAVGLQPLVLLLRNIFSGF